MSLPRYDDLKPFEREQGGFWDYSTVTDVHGNGKTWIPASSLEGAPAARVHRPVTVVSCSDCGQVWPCGFERAVVEARDAARRALASGVEAALLLKEIRDVPTSLGEPGRGVPTTPAPTNQPQSA